MTYVFLRADIPQEPGQGGSGLKRASFIVLSTGCSPGMCLYDAVREALNASIEEIHEVRLAVDGDENAPDFVPGGLAGLDLPEDPDDWEDDAA